MFKKEMMLVLFVSLVAIASLGFVFYSEPSITGAITGFAAKSFLDTANEAVQGLIKTSPDVIIENPLRVSKSIDELFEIQVSEGKEVPLTERIPILASPAEWCGRNWRERDECTKTGGNITGKVTSISGKPEYFCACDCITLLGGKNESVINNRRCVCKNPNLEILGTPPRCQTKCSNTGGRHENNDPTKPCMCPSGTIYLQNQGCTKVIFQNQTSQRPPTQNISATQQASPTPITSTTVQPTKTFSPTPTPTKTQISQQTYLPVTVQTPKTPEYKPPTYLPIVTPYQKAIEHKPPTTDYRPPLIDCKSLLNNLAKQQYDSFLKSWPQINLMTQQPNFRGQFERLRNQLEHALKTFVEYESEKNKCGDDLAEDVIKDWINQFDNSFKRFAEKKVEKKENRGKSKRQK